MKLGVHIGYWGLGLSSEDQLAIVQEAERLGYDSVWTAEAYGSDAATVLAWIAAQTTTIKLGSAIFQMPGRSAAMTAMTAATLDQLSEADLSFLTVHFAAAYEQVDVLLSPTAPTTAFELGAIHDPLTMYLNDICTIPTNLAGPPAMSVPFGTGDDGLPVGVQILAPALGEVPMFRAAAAVEAAAP